ncbi:hypothetical protein AAVH_03146 [Aphelenchoides avenae]|nr:hypothetical protein AAVH_03146 [Aphelenchus avenae]
MSKESAGPDESMEEYEVQVVATPARDNAKKKWMACKFTVKEFDANESLRVPWDELFWDSIGLRPIKKELMRRANVDSVNIVTSCRVRRINTCLADVLLPPEPKKARMKKQKVAVKENRTKNFGRPNHMDESEKTFIYASRKHKALAGRLPVPIITHNERIIQREPDCPLGEPHRCMQGTSRST